MSTKNTILLIVKQNSGIDYNSLLSKFSPGYSNINSARAALSRSLKDLVTFGFLAKRENHYFLTDKGESEIFSELKNKLVLGINEAMRSKDPSSEIDYIVEKLQIILERSTQDRSLLRTSKSSLDFSISDLESVESSLEKKIRHMNYISRVFRDQVDSLKELNFNDSFSFAFTKSAAKITAKLFSSLKDSEFAAEFREAKQASFFADRLSFKSRASMVSVPKEKIQDFFGEIFSLHESAELTLFSSGVKARFSSGKVTLSGPFARLEKVKSKLL